MIVHVIRPDKTELGQLTIPDSQPPPAVGDLVTAGIAPTNAVFSVQQRLYTVIAGVVHVYLLGVFASATTATYI